MKAVKNHYFKKAKQEQYLARSVYKLKEIDNRHRLTRKGIRVLDIGCSPGSWSQYLLERIGPGRVFGIDSAGAPKISDSRFTFIKTDIRSMDPGDLKSRVGTVDLLVSDACPNTSGNKFMDGQRSIEIVRLVFYLSEALLASGGSVVAKVLMGEDVGEFVQNLGQDFEKVILCKPKASRKESRETFIVALHRRAGG
jgi:23S rRNA (uridine2552-2'-O)-methyltransferase